MTDLRMEQYTMPAAELGPDSPLVPFRVDTANLVTKEMIAPDVPEEETRYIGYGYVEGCLPYQIQDGYSRQRRPRSFRAAVLENDQLKATFLLELGGRLWSLRYKGEAPKRGLQGRKPSARGPGASSGAPRLEPREDRELLFVNPVFQPGNLGIRDAWFSGGVEWNFCWIGHTPLTCSPLFAARAALEDGTPALRMWEWERVRQMPYQIDAWLDERAPVLFVRVRLVNRDDRTVPVYWWSNIAVTERPDVRVLGPVDSTYNFGYSGTFARRPFPYRDGNDRSYPTNAPHAGDYFFRIPEGQYPWVASVDGQGKGMFHSSTSRLIGRKIWVFGMGAGGRRWQDFLNTPRHAYIEIQGGLTRIQSECLPMPPRSEWEWLEAFGPVSADAKTVHGQDWPAAWKAVQEQIEAAVCFERIEQELARTQEMARRAPLEILHRGSGWGALERLRRELAGQETFLTPALVFGEETLSREQAPWLELLRGGGLPETDPDVPPVSYMIQDEWRELLEQSIGGSAAGRSDHWLGWLHLGIMYLAQKRYDDARRAWENSLARRPSAWAYRHLGTLAMMLEAPPEAGRRYAQALALAPGNARLAAECGRALIEAGQPGKWLELVETLPPSVRELGRIRLLEAQAALAVDDLDRAGAVLERNLVITDIREGDAGPARLWYAYQAKRLAAAEGVAVDEEIKQRARREFPPPKYLDFRLH